MTFSRFEERAWELWEEIPEHYKTGVDGLMVEREAHAHPTLPDIYTLGECRTEAYPSEYGGPDTIRSAVVLFYGSFWRLSRLDPDFDWDEELWETLTHELQHHLESLAADDELEALDYAADENFKRHEGRPFDPFFYRSGARVGPDAYQVERDYFYERTYDEGVGPGPWIEFEFGGRRHRVRPPARPGDLCFLEVTGGLPADGETVTLVLIRRRRLVGSLWRLLRGARPEVRHAEAAAEPVEAA